MSTLKKASCSTRTEFDPFPHPHVDCDLEFELTKQEVDALNSDPGRAVIAAICAYLGPGGSVAYTMIMERIEDIKSNSSSNGAFVKMTIRDGSNLTIWQVSPL